MSETDELRARIAELKAENKRLNSDIDDYVFKWESETVKAMEAEAENEVLREQNIGMVDDYIEARARIAELESALHEATAAITDDSSGIYAKMERKIGELEAERDAAIRARDNEREDLYGRLDKARAERDRLEQVNKIVRDAHGGILQPAEYRLANRIADAETYMDEWKARAEAAEAERDRLQEQAAAYESCNRARQAAETERDRLAAVVEGARGWLADVCVRGSTVCRVGWANKLADILDGREGDG